MTEESHVDGLGTPPALDLYGWREDAAEYVEFHRLPRTVKLTDRAFRARRRAADLAPLSTKLAHRGGRVDAGPKAKPKAKAK